MDCPEKRGCHFMSDQLPEANGEKGCSVMREQTLNNKLRIPEACLP